MIEESDPILRTAERLCQTLERIGDALVALDADTLLETQETLEQLLATLSTATSVEDKPALAAVVRRSVEALTRCRRLGASFSGMAGTRLRMRTGLETYGRDGGYVQPTVSGSAVKVST
jgi:hypothetical protein